MVYALSVLINPSALDALPRFRFSESRSDLFPILSFSLATVWGIIAKRLTGRLRGLCHSVVLCAVSEQAPGYAGGFVRQPHASSFHPAPGSQFRHPFLVLAPAHYDGA